jgi:hypothetical protein
MCQAFVPGGKIRIIQLILNHCGICQGHGADGGAADIRRFIQGGGKKCRKIDGALRPRLTQTVLLLLFERMQLSDLI